MWGSQGAVVSAIARGGVESVVLSIAPAPTLRSPPRLPPACPPIPLALSSEPPRTRAPSHTPTAASPAAQPARPPLPGSGAGLLAPFLPFQFCCRSPPPQTYSQHGGQGTLRKQEPDQATGLTALRRPCGGAQALWDLMPPTSSPPPSYSAEPALPPARGDPPLGAFALAAPPAQAPTRLTPTSVRTLLKCHLCREARPALISLLRSARRLLLTFVYLHLRPGTEQ